MNKLSVIIITKNEEKNIARCLESVKFADEIIVVDSGSTDKTIEIAESYGAITFYNDWPGDGAQKFLGISKAKNNWCLVLDADENLTEYLKKSILEKLSNTDNSCYKFQRHSYFLGKIMKHGDWGRDWIVRLFDKDKHQWTVPKVHARLDVPKKEATKLDGILLHHSQDSISQSLQKMNDYSNETYKILLNKNKKTSIFNANLHKYNTFFRGYILRRGFLDGHRGYLIAQLSAYGSYFKYIKLWENTQSETDEK